MGEIYIKNPNEGTKPPQNVPKRYKEKAIEGKIRFSETELIEVIKRGQKRGFPLLSPKSGQKPSTTGVADYLKTFERESYLFDLLRLKKAKEVNSIMDDWGLTAKDLLDARVKK